MNRVVYLIRHSKSLRVNNEYNYESLQLQNEKNPLSIEGEQAAKEKMINDELTNLDIIISSNYVRAICTAKYLTANNNKEVTVIPNFGERKFGINSWDELPKNFGFRQWQDNNYKMPRGESILEVKSRCFNELNKLLNKDYKRIAIVSHAMAILSLLKTWCSISISEEKKVEIKFKEKVINIDKIDHCMIFKLEFDNRKLIDISVI